MMEPARLTPWWVINTFGEGPDSSLNVSHFSHLLSHQLLHWSKRSGIIPPEENRKWWAISNLRLPIPQTAADLHSYLTDFLLLNYPLRRKGLEEPSISGAIDTTKLRIAIVGDVRDVMSRTYLHCLGKLIRMDAPELLDAIDVKLLALIFLPHNAHLDKDYQRIAQFLTELHTMMLQSSGELPFESVAFMQDKNFSAPYRRSGYDQLSSTQIVELMCQTLFHSMISEGMALREICERYSPAYLSMASVSIYYDWQQHRQRLAEKASSTLISTFAFADRAPYIDEGEAEIAIESIKEHLATQNLLTELIKVTKSIIKEERLKLTANETTQGSAGTTKTSQGQTKDLQLSLEAVRLSSHRLVESIDVLWKGDIYNHGAKNTIVECIREIFTGRYGSGNARALEQAVLVMKRLEALLAEERADLRAEKFERDLLKELHEIFDLESKSDSNDDKKKGVSMPALSLLQIGELLSSIPLWAKLLGLLVPASGYLFYRYRKLKLLLARKQFETEIAIQQNTRSVQRELQKEINYSLTNIYLQAITLVRKLELFISGVRANIPPQIHANTGVGYESTTFCRSVFEELTVPGRPVLKPLIMNGEFAPALNVGERKMKFDEFKEHSELGILINKFLADKPGVKDYLTPFSIDDIDSDELSIKSATKLSSQFYEFAYDLYDQSPQLEMNDALRQIKKTGNEDALVAFAAEAAWPPVIFSQATTQRPPVYLELKYHDVEVFEEVLGNQFNGRWGTLKQLQPIRNGGLLSFGIFQPVPIANRERCALNSIHTIAAMRTQINMDELRDPSLVFTLATLPPKDDGTYAPALVNALEGIRMLPPAPLLNDIEKFRRELTNVSLARRPNILLWVEDGKKSLKETSLLPTEGAEDETYNVVTVALFKDHLPSEPLQLNQHYMLQAAFYEEGFEFSSEVPLTTLFNEKAVKIDVMVHAEGMDIQPTWFRPIIFKRRHTPQFAEFTLKPIEEGRKTVHIEFLHANRWLTGIKFEVEVVTQEPLVLIS